MATVADLEKRLDRQDERISSIESYNSGMNEKMIRLDEKMNSSNSEMKRINDKIVEVATDVKTLIMEPGKKYNILWVAAASSIISGIIGFAIAFVAK